MLDTEASRANLGDIRLSMDYTINGHPCKLINRPVSPLLLMIDSGIFIKFRRALIRLINISWTHPLTRRAYRSSSAIREEEIRLLSCKIIIIHPFSRFALFWEFLMGFVFVSYYLTTMLLCFHHDHIDDPNYGSFIYPFIVLDVFFVADLIKNFGTGYYNILLAKAVLKPRLIAKQYAKSTLILDVVPLIHEMVLYVCPQYLMHVRLLLFVKFLRAPRVADSMELWCLFSKYSNMATKLFNFIVITILLLLTIFTFLFMLRNNIHRRVHFYGNYTENTPWDTIPEIDRSLMVYEMIFRVQSADFYYNFYNISRNMFDQFCDIFIMLIGYCFHLFLFVHIYKLWTQLYSEQFEDVDKQFSQYLKYKRLPQIMRKKFREFYEYKYLNQYYNETKINKMLPKLIKQEILVNLTKNHMDQVDFFKGVPDNILIQWVARLKSEIYLKNDVIVKAGLPGNSMYFIYFGTVAIYSSNGEELCHLEDGANFGEIALIFDQPRTASVVALTSCEIFRLSRHDFGEVLAPYPEVKEKIIAIALDRWRQSGSLFEYKRMLI